MVKPIKGLNLIVEVQLMRLILKLALMTIIRTVLVKNKRVTIALVQTPQLPDSTTQTNKLPIIISMRPILDSFKTCTITEQK